MEPDKKHIFSKELQKLINCHSMDNGCNTPDFLLAEYLSDCLDSFDRVVKAREKWYGREAEPVCPQPDTPSQIQGLQSIAPQQTDPAPAMPTMKYRKKPVIIEAEQWSGSNLSNPDSMFRDLRVIAKQDGLEFNIGTLEGVMTGKIGDWLIRGVKGEMYPCKPDIFAATYDAVI